MLFYTSLAAISRFTFLNEVDIQLILELKKVWENITQYVLKLLRGRFLGDPVYMYRKPNKIIGALILIQLSKTFDFFLTNFRFILSFKNVLA